MSDQRKIRLIQNVMGASHVFCTSVGELLERTLEESSGADLAMSQVKLLLLIAQPGHRFKVMDVAQFLGVTNAAASRSIERLVQRGLVNRTVSPEDRRAVELTLTDAAERLLEGFTAARNRELLRLLGDHPDEKLQRAGELLDELSVLLLDPAADPHERCLRCGVHFRDGCVLRDVLGRECVVARGLYGENGDGADDHADDHDAD